MLKNIRLFHHAQLVGYLLIKIQEYEIQSQNKTIIVYDCYILYSNIANLYNRQTNSSFN